MAYHGDRPTDQAARLRARLRRRDLKGEVHPAFDVYYTS